jgi:4-hydroxy-tetrahydrodipicolinate synthase
VIDLAPDFLRGSYPPLVTPFVDGAVDEGRFAALVERQVTEGSDGVVVTGTTGEPSTLTLDERARLTSIAVDVTAGRIPVVAATGSQSHAETVSLTERAAVAGADAVMVVTPYFSKPPQRGLVEYYCDLGRRVDAPLLVYHIPGRAAVSVDVATMEQIAERTPTLVGVKHASTDLDYVSSLRSRLGAEFRIFVGLEELSLPMMAVGATGLMNAVGNLVPGMVAALARAVLSGDLHAAQRLHSELLEVNRAIHLDTNPIPLKYLLRRAGLLARNEHRLPMVPASRELEARLDDLAARSPVLAKLMAAAS